jgi:DNA-binding response OmpR family regulator
LKGLNILILEDDPAVLSLLIDTVEQDGHLATGCATVKEFHRKNIDHHYDIYLLDVNLPDGSGLNLIQTLRSGSDSGILIVTGSVDEIDTVLALEMGADDNVKKPFRVRELRARIKSVARRMTDRTIVATPSGADDLYSFHGMVVNRRSRTLRHVDGGYIDLTTLEFDLLVALLSRTNVVLTRNELMDSIRGPDWAAYDRNIDGLISRLRTKLFEPASGKRIIKTVRGVGYMLCVD